jgi:hypothetical protein
LAVLFLSLLASADQNFADIISGLRSHVTANDVVARPIVFALVTFLTLGLIYLTVSGPDWSHLAWQAKKYPVGVWLIPLITIDVVLVAFLGISSAVLFGRYDKKLFDANVTYADRVHQGFGQLIAVTLLTLVLLGWAGRVAGREDTVVWRQLVPAAGVMVLATLLIIASALWRLWLYQEAYGWTVYRYFVGWFEAWLALVVLVLAAAWLFGKTRLVARLLVLAASVGVLILVGSNPDALVARWNVDRFQHTGKFDLSYAMRMSEDAAPELNRLPGDWRVCAFARKDGKDSSAWYAVNLPRREAARIESKVKSAGQETDRQMCLNLGGDPWDYS